METGPYANPAQAAVALRKGLAADPGNLTFRKGLMALYRGQGRLREALAMALDGPLDGELGRMLRMVRAELGEAGELLEQVKGAPDEAELVREAAAWAVAALQWPAALALFGRAVALRPEDWEAWLMACKALLQLHRLEEAEAMAAGLLEQAGPEGDLRAQLGFLRGVSLMLRGRFEEGLPWLECRFAMEDGPPVEALPVPFWQGGPLAGKTLLIQAEQGYGDTFMMARYVAGLARQGAKVLVRPLAGTGDLLATCEGLAGLAEGQVILPGDALQATLMSLPGLCGTRLDTIPDGVPYLWVPRSVPGREAIDACLDGAGPGLKVGLVWAGNPRHALDGLRSIPPELLEVFAALPGIVWVDLQVPAGPRPGLPMVDLARHLGTFSATAYALERLDGLISVDTATVHLAGALGRPAWLALPWLPDWRWLMDRRDSPWYPTLELWRQPAPGDWASVLENMRVRLGEDGFRIIR